MSVLAGKELRIVGFLCNWCSYGGADTAGTARAVQPTDLRIIRVPCSGRVNPLFVLKALINGADGVLVSGCHPRDCHYSAGNYYARRNMDILFAQFVNLTNVLTGNDEIISQVNGVFFHTGLNNTNVRTMFGTIAVYTNPGQFIFVTLLLSTVIYSLKVLSIRFGNIYLNIIYFFECAMLCMGWFEYYFFHLDVIEVPVMTLIVMTIVLLTRTRQHES